MSRRLRTYAYAGLLALLPASGRTNDQWESGFIFDDDNSDTANELVHGSVQRGHDLEYQSPTNDQDWMVLRSKTRHSYEARVISANVTWSTDPSFPRAGFDRVTATGAVLTAGLADGASVLFPSTVVVRWIASTGTNEYLRADSRSSHYDARDMYDVDLYDTTYFMPRFNNSSSQVTILVIQNTKDSLVTGEIYFYNGAGTLLSTQPLSIPAQGVQVLNSATIPALVGQSGSVTIAQLGGYGALAGKGVSLEPSTGFTFDTALAPLPR